MSARALYVLAVPDAPELPQKIKDIADPFVRLRVAPPRIEWMRRYLGWVGDTARRIATFEEAKRSSDFEDQVIAWVRRFRRRPADVAVLGDVARDLDLTHRTELPPRNVAVLTVIPVS